MRQRHSTRPFALVKPPAPRAETPLVAATDRLLGALADVLEAAHAEGIEPPRQLMAELGMWALRFRFVQPCAACDEPTPGPPTGPRLCPSCAAPLPPRAAGR